MSNCAFSISDDALSIGLLCPWSQWGGVQSSLSCISFSSFFSAAFSSFSSLTISACLFFHLMSDDQTLDINYVLTSKFWYWLGTLLQQQQKEVRFWFPARIRYEPLGSELSVSRNITRWKWPYIPASRRKFLVFFVNYSSRFPLQIFLYSVQSLHCKRTPWRCIWHWSSRS